MSESLYKETGTGSPLVSVGYHRQERTARKIQMSYPEL